MSNYTPTVCFIKRTLETILVFLVFSGRVWCCRRVFRFLRFIVLLQSSPPTLSEAESFLKQWETGSRLLMALELEWRDCRLFRTHNDKAAPLKERLRQACVRLSVLNTCCHHSSSPTCFLRGGGSFCMCMCDGTWLRWRTEPRPPHPSAIQRGAPAVFISAHSPRLYPGNLFHNNTHGAVS